MKKTDWDLYYKRPNPLAGITKAIIRRRLLYFIRKYSRGRKNFSVLEFGGGNSCFYEGICREFEPSVYWVLDNNPAGLAGLEGKAGKEKKLRLLKRDILDPAPMPLEVGRQDLCFSVGLIEHFSVEGTRQAIMAHFHVLAKGGILILGFPTPTWLYRVTRKILEILGLWRFPDERPLPVEEVLETVGQYGELLEKKVIWSIFLTQAMLVIRLAMTPTREGRKSGPRITRINAN